MIPAEFKFGAFGPELTSKSDNALGSLVNNAAFSSIVLVFTCRRLLNMRIAAASTDAAHTTGITIGSIERVGESGFVVVTVKIPAEDEVLLFTIRAVTDKGGESGGCERNVSGNGGGVFGFVGGFGS